MSAYEITDALLARLASAAGGGGGQLRQPEHGRTPRRAAGAVRAVGGGRVPGRLAQDVLARGGALLITADHGNCEVMRDPETGQPHTAHPRGRALHLDPGGARGPLREGGALEDVAPTMLGLLAWRSRWR